jgi:hypothetical protein
VTDLQEALARRYVVQTVDGEPLPDDAIIWVMRVDPGEHFVLARAGIDAVRAYAKSIDPHAPEIAEGLRKQAYAQDVALCAAEAEAAGA